MKNTVRHYWAKTVDGEYGGLLQQFIIELLAAAFFIFICIYSLRQKGLEIFFVAFIVPTLIFVIAAATTLYTLLAEHADRRKTSRSDAKDAE